ncbi:hypothetical protein ACPRNU_06155 [Chromobacterium vaccinii]|uniref:hypothetical protein n=1 Tax=Chromobacterium TaxID=535 RepID=UPI001305347F|nr:hypothetical protein [Chromobacterium sp. ATCC 53434]
MEKKLEITASHVANRILIAIHIDRIRSFLLEVEIQLRKQDICRAACFSERARLTPCRKPEKEIDEIINNEIMNALQEIDFLAQNTGLATIMQESRKSMIACRENNPKAIRQALLNLIMALEREIS